MIPQNLTIINYHKIENKSDIGLTTRRPDQFTDDLHIIRDSGYTPVTFKEMTRISDMPDKPVIITFDDAYLSFYERALDILATHKMNAVLFVPVNYIGKKNNWDVQFFKKTYWHMNSQQITESALQGMEIGSHGLSHRHLNGMSDKNLEHELRKSKATLEEIISSAVISVSYPFGRVTERVLRKAADFYTFGVQQLHKQNNQHPFKELCLSRINIYRNDNPATFKKKLEYNKHALTRFTNRLIQNGALATVLMQKLLKQNEMTYAYD